MRNYYLNYEEKAKINYCFLFALFMIAQKDQKDKMYNTVVYQNLKELSNRIKEQCNYNISVSTISRILNNKDYLPYISKNENENKILLNTNFKRGIAASNKFVIINTKEILFLLDKKNNLLNKYYLYLKYYCGYSKSKRIDTTANQILSAIGYSNNCGNNKNNLCQYNSLLLENGFINIEKIKDKKGYCRNIYSMNI